MRHVFDSTVAQPTYELLKDAFELEPRGTIPVKGKGEMKTWYCRGPVTTSEAAKRRPRVG
ncbi:MAG TPA: hypothetical protein VNT92_10095 [Acidimicrobiia bacterium]|nr:hypothetical protein [Acidimicrobiia bacterium]